MLQAILQSKVTVLLLTSLSVLTAAKQYLGDPIHCIFDARSGVKTEAIDAFCWIHATFPLDPSLIEKLSNLPGRGIRVVFYQTAYSSFSTNPLLSLVQMVNPKT